MAFTPHEARGKRCCGPEGTGSIGNVGTDRYCIGDECMAWRHVSGGVADQPRGVCGLAAGRVKMTMRRPDDAT